MIAPLRKRRPTGELYTRPPDIEALLIELSALTRDELIDRAEILSRTDSDYIPSECLVYFVRSTRADNSEDWFEQLYKILAARVLRLLPKAESRDDKTESLTQGNIRDNVFSRFVDLLIADRANYQEKLDFFEIRFDSALKKLRLTEQKRARRNEKRSFSLEYDDETGEISPEVEQAAGCFDPFAEPEIDGEVYRLRLDEAIEGLPLEQKRIIEMLRQGFPIDSQEPNVMTIAKALSRSEKTVRTYRDKAIATLQAALTEGDTL